MSEEVARLAVLASYGLDDLQNDDELQRIARFAARLCEAPIALVSLVEDECQRFIARTGLDANATPRPTSFCAHAMFRTEPMEVPDARLDERFSDNPLVTGAPHIRFYVGAPLVSVEGAPLGSLCIIDTVPRPEGLTQLQREGLEVLARSVMQRLLAERQDRAALKAIGRREKELRHMLDSVPGIAWSATRAGGFDMFNARWKEATGAEPPLTLDDWEPFLHPDDRSDIRRKWETSLERGEMYSDQFRLKQTDGEYRWVLSHATPVIEDRTEQERWFGTVIDIDDAHRASEARDLLASELSHRIKNIFAVISSLISMRARSHDNVRDFAADIAETVRALGTAHDYVRPVDGRSSESLREMLREMLAPYQNASGKRVTVEGPGIGIGSRAATPLALIFHELATNAAKYGAFARLEGKVCVKIARDADDGETVRMSWIEEMPGFDPPTGDARKGFGSRLIEMAINSQLGGAFEKTFLPEGLRVDITVPSAALTA